MPRVFRLGRRLTGTLLGAPLLLCIGLQGDCLAADKIAGPLVGTWRLVGYTDTVAGEAPIHAFGTDPVGLCAYFGSYEVNYQTSTWITHVRGGNIPAYLGTDQSRHFSVHGDRLVISESYDEGGRAVRAERVLVRESRR
jgi:hypothetical protein